MLQMNLKEEKLVSQVKKWAIAYIKAEYEKLKIPAAKANGDYFQEVPIRNK